MRVPVAIGSLATILVFGLVAWQSQLDSTNASSPTNTSELALVENTFTSVFSGSGETLALLVGLMFVGVTFAVLAKSAS